MSLPNKNADCPSGKKMLFTGWGKDRYNNQGVLNIQEQPSTKYLNGIHLKCKEDKKNSPSIFVEDSPNRRNTLCFGDSGGMFYSNHNFLIKLFTNNTTFLDSFKT